MTDNQKNTENQNNDAFNLPLFYIKPQPLNIDRHENLALKKDIDYAFAANTNSVPLNAIEFPLALKFYPIVFVDSDPATPVAILGLRNGDNLFVGTDGKWREKTYIPSYVQRYPFIFLEVTESDQLILCVDEESTLVEENGENKFFNAGEASDLSKLALEMCSQYQAQFNFTTAFTKALKEKDLFEPHQADITLASGEKISLGGFNVISEKKFNALDDKTIIEWKEKGWLHLVYAHFMSMMNWTDLIDATTARIAQTGTRQ